MLRPEVISAVTEMIHYVSDTIAAWPGAAPELPANPAIHPDTAHGPHLCPSARLGARLERPRIRVWSGVKTED